MCRNAHDAFIVSDQNVTRKDRDPAAGDRVVDGNRVVLDQVCRGTGPVMVGGHLKRADLGCVAKPAISDDPGTATRHEPCNQDASGRGRPRILTGIDGKNRADGAFLDTFTLRIGAVRERVQPVKVAVLTVISLARVSGLRCVIAISVLSRSFQ